MIRANFKHFINDPHILPNMDFISLRFNNKIVTFKEKFKIFTDLSVNEKIGKDSKGEYWVYKEGYLPYQQQICRMWYRENRDLTITQLDTDFNNFIQFLDLFKNEYQTDNAGDYTRLRVNLCEFIDSIIPGLYNLKQTYKDYLPMINKIDAIIFTLLDFKECVNKTNETRQQTVNYDKIYSISI